MEHLRFFLQNLKKIRFQVWNFVKFQTWNRIIFNFFKKNRKYSKINEIYLFGNVSDQILSKIRATFVRRFLQGISFIKNFPWELLVKWTRIKFKGNSLTFFSRRSEKNTKDFLVKKNPWEFYIKWTRIKFKGNSLYFFSRRSEKKIQRISL